MSKLSIPLYKGTPYLTPLMKIQSEIFPSSEDGMMEINVELNTPFNEDCDYFYVKPVHYLQKTWSELSLNDSGEIVIEDFNKKCSYNEDTKELYEELSPIDDEELFKKNYSSVISFASNVLKRNKWAYKTFMETTFKGNGYTSWNMGQVAINVYILFVKKPDLLEKLLKTGSDILTKTLNSKLDLEGNVKDVFKLPQSAINTIVKLGYSEVMSHLTEIAEKVDGNDIITLVSFIENTKKIHGKSKPNKIRAVNNFLIQFKKLIVDYSFPVRNTLEYVIKQSYMYHEYSFDTVISMCNEFADYTRMKNEFGIGEKWPQNLSKAHNVMSVNVRNCDNATKIAFKRAVALYTGLETEINVDKVKYVVIAPKSVEDLMREGDALNHCVGSYAKLIATGMSKVLFLRRADNPEKSLVTFEFNDGLKVTHAKGINNTDPEPIESKALKFWENWAKKKGVSV